MSDQRARIDAIIEELYPLAKQQYFQQYFCLNGARNPRCTQSVLGTSQFDALLSSDFKPPFSGKSATGLASKTLDLKFTQAKREKEQVSARQLSSFQPNLCVRSSSALDVRSSQQRACQTHYFRRAARSAFGDMHRSVQ